MPDPAPLKRDLSRSGGQFPGVDGVLADRFHIEARLGAGGMGEVYRARDTTLRRLVAIKRTRRAASEADRKRFLREGQRATALNHSGIAAIYDVFTEGGEVYLVMEYVEGETLRARLARPISESEFRRIPIESATALAAAHDKGILHHDIKPENIMLTSTGNQRGLVKLLDFGLAQQATEETGVLETATAVTAAGMLAGTPQYMAPEVLNGEPADRRSDIFALGVVFYEMLSGHHPFAAATPTAMIGQILHQPPLPLDATIPAPSAAIVNRALAKFPADRYPTAHEIVYDLNHVDLKNPDQNYPAPLPVSRRRSTALALAVLIVAIVAASATYLLLRQNHSSIKVANSRAITAGTLAVLPPVVANAQVTKLDSFGRGLSESLAKRLSDLSVNHDIAVLAARQLEDRKVTTPAQAAHELGATSFLMLTLTGDDNRAEALRIPFGGGAVHLFCFRVICHPKIKAAELIVYSNLAAALSSQDKNKEAVDALKKSIALHPTAGAYRNLGVAFFKFREFDEAAEGFRRSIQLAPDAYDSWFALGDAEYYGGHQSQATKDYKKALELAMGQLKASPNDANILGDIAGIYSMLGDASQAMDFMNRSLVINHTDSELMFNAAQVYNQLHQTGPAIEWLGKALAAGYPPSVIANAPAMDNLHSNPRYQQLMQSTHHQP